MTDGFLTDLFRSISRKGRALLPQGRDGTDVSGTSLTDLAKVLLSNKGEASGMALSRHFLALYKNSDDTQKARFFTSLDQHFGPDEAKLNQAISSYQQKPGSLTALKLHTAAEPRRQELLRRLNLAPGGTAKLVEMRTDLLKLLKTSPELRAVDQDFVHLFSSWFNRGFLVIKKIDWSTPATILEKIIQYEAVHAIGDWEELRRRIEPEDRCCFAFFHPALLDEPLIFVEVALTDKIPDAIAPVLKPDREAVAFEEIDTAVFYSISNCQKGLKGVSFGSFLIKQVVEELKQNYPSLKTFITLSPVPGFRRWFDEQMKTQPQGSPPAYDPEATELLKQENWWQDEEKSSRLKEVLLPAITDYLIRTGSTGALADPVARFHLGNGARLERINWRGDCSEKGIRQAAGFMVNYLYDIQQIEKNHEQYATTGKVKTGKSIKTAK